MTARSPNAFMLSATLHGAVAATVLLGAWAAQKAVSDRSPVFELVAGGGDNFNALNAPALGDPSGSKFSVPSPVPPRPVVVPAPVAESATPQPPAKVASKTPVVTKTPAPASPSKTTTPSKTTPPAKPAPPAKLATPQKQAAGATAPTNYRPINAQGIANGVVGGSSANTKGGAGGKALDRQQASELDNYFSMLQARLLEALVKPDGLFQTRVEFLIHADGSITGIRILQRSGNAAFDESALAAFRAIRPLGPTPTGQSYTKTVLFTAHDGD